MHGGSRDAPKEVGIPGLSDCTHLSILKLGSKGRHILGQFDGLALCIIEHACDTLHFILRRMRDW